MLRAIITLFAALKFSKVLLSGGTMLISVFAYALIFGVWYAVGFVLLIFVHEMGHYLAARQRGLNVGLPTFIPFVGAWIAMKDMPRNVEVEAYVGLAGPVVGTLGALACYYLARGYDSNLLLALSYSGFFLNLFNLIPLSPFDGGRVTAIISPRVWLVGVPIMIAFFFYHPSPMFILIAIIAVPQVIKAIKYDSKAPENIEYYSVTTATKWKYGSYYMMLIVFLSAMTYEVDQMLQVVRSGYTL